MGGCVSRSMEGGGGAGRNRAAVADGPNDAVDYIHQMCGLDTSIELSFSASNLLAIDAFKKIDPMLVVYTEKDRRLEEIGRTEVILHSSEPSWIMKTTTAYHFEIVQPLIFSIYDVDSKYHDIPAKRLDLAQLDFRGEARCNLSEVGTTSIIDVDRKYTNELSIVTKFNHCLTLNLQSGGGQSGMGTITVHAEESDSSRVAVDMTLRCQNLQNKDLFSKSDPFLRISKLVETAGAIPICKTEVITDNLNPLWRPITLTSEQYGSKENPLLVECFDFDCSGNHELIGAFQTTITQLETMYNSRSGANFYNHKKRSKLPGQLFVDKFQGKVQHTFLDYISSGFELNFMVAVDFTASNGDPRAPQSLHYIDPSGRPNPYQQAILGFSKVLQFYDSDRRFRAWGFGAKAQNHVSHCFNLNTATNNCEVVGVEGIMSAYTTALYNVSLDGPTKFGPVINKATEIACQSFQNANNKYFVLLIITDGVLTDFQDTQDCIVRASDLPLSILIVGVGNADFKQMESLTAWNSRFFELLAFPLNNSLRQDIIRFVPMRNGQGGEIPVIQTLLEELPGQFLTYMRSRGIKPQAPRFSSAPGQ